jgi:capsular polysaccharide biosynthesis protein
MFEPLTAVAITLMRKMTMMITITALIMLICTMMMMLFFVVSPLYKIVWHAAGDTT